jgi:hypothetical protein
VTIKSGTDLLLGANYVQTGTTGPGSGFTQRLLSGSHSDLVEDQVVTATGTYSATASLRTQGWWVMQMVALRAAPSYVQGNYAMPPQATLVPVTYTAAQAAGNLNAVIVGWSDSAAQMTSVTDVSGNVYKLAVGPTRLSGTASLSIYYARNIVAAPTGANAVTVSEVQHGGSFPGSQNSGVQRN